MIERVTTPPTWLAATGAFRVGAEGHASFAFAIVVDGRDRADRRAANRRGGGGRFGAGFDRRGARHEYGPRHHRLSGYRGCSNWGQKARPSATSQSAGARAAQSPMRLGINDLPSSRRSACLHQALIEPIGIGSAWPFARRGGRLRHGAEIIESRVRRAFVLIQPGLRRAEARPSAKLSRQVDFSPIGIVEEPRS